MTKIVTYNEVEYEFDDAPLTTKDWLAIPFDKDPKLSQVELLIERSINPKLTMESILLTGFGFVGTVAEALDLMGE